MKIDRLMIIPQKDNMKEYMQLAGKYDCGFEYNDFFLPALLDDREELDKRIEFYTRPENKVFFSTVHGAFLDVTVFSDDARIREVSELRVNQSLEVARRLGAEAVIFHTNYISNFNLTSYRENWVERNADFYSRKLEEYPMVKIYIENMFDEDYRLLARLGEKMRDFPNFGICLDYAHANVFGDEKNIDNWIQSLAPYVRHLHINDNDFTQDLHLALGEGKINWQQFLRYYEKYFCKASVLLEVTGLAKTRKSLEFIREMQ